jgi:hypothetical protein
LLPLSYTAHAFVILDRIRNINLIQVSAFHHSWSFAPASSCP